MSEPTKRKKYYAKFDDEWLNKVEFKSWLQRLDCETAYCKVCKIKFSVNYEGVRAINVHLESTSHKNTTETIQSNQLMTAFMCVNGKEKNEIFATMNKIIFKNLITIFFFRYYRRSESY